MAKVMLNNVRLAFPKLFKAEQVNGQGEPKFSACFIIEPGSANAKALKDAMLAVATEKWKDKTSAIYALLKKDDKLCFREEAKTNSSGEVYDGFNGKNYVNSSSPTKPLVIDRDRTPLQESDGRPYGGCFVNAQLDVWPQDNKFGKRINATLKAVQFVRDGDAFAGGAPASVDDFADMSAEEPAAADGLAG